MPPKTYDVIIVGSGATGGWAAKLLTEKGLRVVILEAGRKLDPMKDYSEHRWPYETERRGFGNRAELERKQPIQSRCYACNEYGHQFFVNDLDNPYTTPPNKPFFWIRSRQVGGRSIPWGRQSYRLSNLDFKAASHDGYGDDWPIGYEELAPYYDQVEEYVGISGQAENLPQLPDSKFLPPMAYTCGERLLKKAIEKMGDPHRRVTIGRVAILTKRIHEGTKDERYACHWCGHCDRGCTTGSYYSSPHSTLPAAQRTGRSTLVPNAVVREVLVDKNTGRARGVAYVDAVTREHREVYARAVVLCAGTLESTRILLNSRSAAGAEGLANSSGVLGHYLMDHVGGGGASGTMPMLDSKVLEQDGRANGIYVARFRNVDKNKPHGKFIRGYGFQGGVQAPGARGAPVGHQPRRLRRVAGALREPRPHQQGRGGRLGHPSPPHRHGLRRQRAPDGRGHGRDGRRHARSRGRQGRARQLRADFDAGHPDPRGRHRAHGRRPEEVGPQQVQPGVGREEPVRHRRRLLRLVRQPEPDAHHDGDHGAGLRLPRRGASRRAALARGGARR
jgi:choline dehydrogenase-like flavoprotein